MASPEIESTLPEPLIVAPPSSCSASQRDGGGNCCLPNLRGVWWRTYLGSLPSFSLSSIDDLRRAAANSRRRYAGLRKRILVDPHVPMDGRCNPDIIIDNPLSQSPDSNWGRFFRNAEVEKMVDQDLCRLYPEHESYFQTAGCQGMLRRILILWCLQHPETGYRQGMHELLAPLLYVLHVDVERLSQVRKLYEDLFTDRFDGLSFDDCNLTYNFDLKKKLPDSTEDISGSHGNLVKARTLDELDPEIKAIVMLSDAYGAEGELGIVLSEKFMEHDAFCMFDALMSGGNGAVAMADFFSPSPPGRSQTGLPPVIEASAELYHLLCLVDSSLHSHLVELGVEPQYFSLRWLRVLFGREFALKHLLIIWDEIFASDNSKLDAGDGNMGFKFLNSSRGAFIAGIAVSMLLYLRSSLLASENATSCLQRLLNFPEDVDLNKLMEKAKSLQTVALDADFSFSLPSFSGAYSPSKSVGARGHSLSFDSTLSKTPINVVPESYWEEKWRVLHKEEEVKQPNSRKHIPTPKRGWSEKVRFLSRRESDPAPVKLKSSQEDSNSSVRRKLLEDLSQKLGLDEVARKLHSEDRVDDRHTVLQSNDMVDEKNNDLCEEGEEDRQNESEKGLECEPKKGLACESENGLTSESETACLSGSAAGEENSSVFSSPTSPLGGANNHVNDSARSSVSSSPSIDEINDMNNVIVADSPLPVSFEPENVHSKSASNNDSVTNSVTETKDRKPLSGKLQWLWKFGRNAVAEGASDSVAIAGENTQSNTACSSAVDESSNSSVRCKGNADQNVMGTLRNLSQSMLENIQVIESAFQQDKVQVGSFENLSFENLSKNHLVGKGQVTAMAALKELRKISNLLSEM